MRILDDVRRQGYSLVDEELEVGLRSVAVPIVSSGGQVMAAMNVSAQAGRVSCDELLHSVLPVLLEQAASVRSSLVG
jgi:IclR family pca regulon transcriptional regulator